MKIGIKIIGFSFLAGNLLAMEAEFPNGGMKRKDGETPLESKESKKRNIEIEEEGISSPEYQALASSPESRSLNSSPESQALSAEVLKALAEFSLEPGNDASYKEKDLTVKSLESCLNEWSSLSVQHKENIVNALLLDTANALKSDDKLKVIMRFIMNPVIAKDYKLEFLSLYKTALEQRSALLEWRKSNLSNTEESQQSSEATFTAWVRSLIDYLDSALTKDQTARGRVAGYPGLLKPDNVDQFSIKYELDTKPYALMLKKEEDFSRESKIRSLLHDSDPGYTVPIEVLECFRLLGDEFYTELSSVMKKLTAPAVPLFQFLDKHNKLQDFLTLQHDEHRTLLHHALYYSQKKLAQVLVSAILKKYGSYDNLPAELQDIKVHIAIIAGNNEVAKGLITEDTIDAASSIGEDDAVLPPLWVAVLFGNIEMVRYLLEKGADYNLYSSTYIRSGNLLHLAARKGYTDCVKILLERGANVKEEDYDHNTPFTLAANDETQKLILAYVVDKYLQAIDKEEREDIARVVSDTARTRENTLIHVAARLGCVDLLERLLKQSNININAQNSNAYFSDEDPDEGYTALHEAIREGHSACVRMLLEHKANPNIQTKKKKMSYAASAAQQK